MVHEHTRPVDGAWQIVFEPRRINPPGGSRYSKTKMRSSKSCQMDNGKRHYRLVCALWPRV